MKYIFIDIDNTLLSFDEYVKQSMITGFKKFGLPAYEPWMFDVFNRENGKLWVAIEDRALTFDELIKIRWNKIFEALGIDFDGPTFETYFRQYLNQSAIPMDGAYELLDYLKASGRYILCIASNGPEEQQHNRLRLGNMHDYFTHFFISGGMGCAKPSADYIRLVFEELQKTYCKDGEAIDPAECMIIGDSMTSDMTFGFNAGLKTCFYNPKEKEVNEPRLDYIVKDLREIKQIL